MAILVLSSGNHASFTSSVWERWASAPYDLHLVAEVNMKAFIKTIFHKVCIFVRKIEPEGKTTLDLILRFSQFVNLLRMEWLKPTVECSSHCLPTMQLLRLYHTRRSPSRCQRGQIGLYFLRPALCISFDDIQLCNYRIIVKISLNYHCRQNFENTTQY